jgi:hypothetical protein
MGEQETIEIRQVQEFDEFPQDVQKAADGFREMKETADARRES